MYFLIAQTKSIDTQCRRASLLFGEMRSRRNCCPWFEKSIDVIYCLEDLKEMNEIFSPNKTQGLRLTRMNNNMSRGCQKGAVPTRVDARVRFACLANNQRFIECSLARWIIRKAFSDIHQRIVIACPLNAEMLFVEGVRRTDSTN